MGTNSFCQQEPSNMTECNTDRLDFTPHGRRQIVGDFLGGRLTSDGGELLLHEVDRRIGLIDAVNDAIPDPRDPRYIVHSQRSMLAQRIVSLALDYEDQNDQENMRVDPTLQLAADCNPVEDNPMASPPAL